MNYIVVLSLLQFLVTLSVVVADMESCKAAVKLNDKEDKALKAILQGTNKFAIDLYKALSDNKTSGNVFVSPLSAQIVLAQAFIGARDSTADGLAKMLSLPDDLQDTLTGYNSLIRVLKDPVLNVANRIFVESSANIKKDFQKKIEQHFLATAEAVDFQNNAESTRKKINAWVEEQTNKKITDLLAPNTVTSDTRLVLTNAIHFKDNWEKQFLESRTNEQHFYTSKTKTVPVQMMHTKETFEYTHDDTLGAKILGMNYEGGNFRMVVILPDEIDGLKSVEAKLVNVDLNEKIKGLRRREVQVALPKFKLEETMMLNDIIKSLGAGAMFSAAEANFSGISDEKLVVSLVVQKSFVEVNEKGTEAAAATAVHIRTRRAISDAEDFIADHPFMLIITHSFSDGVIFVGRFSAPSIVQIETDKQHDEF